MIKIVSDFYNDKCSPAYINNCKKYSDAKTKNEIYKAPKVLILFLNTGKGISFECDVDFEKELDISSFKSYKI